MTRFASAHPARSSPCSRPCSSTSPTSTRSTTSRTATPTCTSPASATTSSSSPSSVRAPPYLSRAHPPYPLISPLFYWFSVLRIRFSFSFFRWRVLIHLFHRSNYAFGAFLSSSLFFLSLLPFLFLTIFPLLFFFLCNVPLLSLSEHNTQWNVTCTN